MALGAVVFAILFLALPLLAFLAAVLVPGWAFGLMLLGLGLLLLSPIGLPFVDLDER